MSKKSDKKPLLYIQQSFSMTPSKNMQEIFTFKQESDHLTEEQEAETNKKTISLEKKEVNQENLSNEQPLLEKLLEASSTLPEDINRAIFTRVKPFKEMDVKERLEYLINFPKVLPPVPCVFYTHEENYQGYLTKYEDDQITVKFHDQTTKIFPLEKITNVIMIGI